MSSSTESNTFWQLVASDLGVPVNGLAFIYDAFDYARQERDYQDKASLGHFSAADYCDAFLRHAKDTFGEGYVSALKSWGLDTSEKVGCVIYKLVDRGLIDRQESDCQSEFRGQFDFSHVSAPVWEYVSYQTPVRNHIYGRWQRLRHVALQAVGLPITLGFFLAAAILSGIFTPFPFSVFLLLIVITYSVIQSILRQDVRYSLRTLLIGMTLAALVLGLSMALTR